MIKSLSAMALVAALSLASPALAQAQAHDHAHDHAATAKPLPPVTAADRVLGRADAPVTVVEYASFTCSHCAAWHNEVLPTFKARYIDTGKVRLVFRDLPTQPVNLAATAAAVGRCSASGRFFDVAKSLMAGQAALFSSRDAAAWLKAGVDASGRTEQEIEACISTPAISTALNADVQAAVAAGVTGTPAFFVNGRPVQGHSMEALSAAIDPLVRGR